MTLCGVISKADRIPPNVKCYFIVGVIALRHLPTLLNVDVDVENFLE